jgi:hypothetical protein
MVPVIGASISGVFSGARPSVALLWAPGHADARANLALRLSGAGVSADGHARARALAADAIRRDPLSVDAFRALGLVAESEGNRALARRFFDYGESLSRRDQPTQIWLAQESLRDGNPIAMIRHIDTAMRTSSRNWDSLIALLIYVTRDPRSVAPLGALLDRKPVWSDTFLTRLVTTGPSLQNVVGITRGRLNPQVAAQRELVQHLIDRLVADRQFQLALRVYEDARPVGARQSATAGRDGGFEAPGGLAPFDWQLAQEPELSGFRQQRTQGAGSALYLLAANGRTGEVARQLLRLPPSTYQLRAEVGSIPELASERPEIALSCADRQGDVALLTVRPATAGDQSRMIGGQFTVPAACLWQWMVVRLSGGGPARENLPWVDNISIRSAARPAG